MSNPSYQEPITILRSYALSLNFFQRLFFPSRVLLHLQHYSPEQYDHSKAFQIYSELLQSRGILNWIGQFFLSGLKQFRQDVFTQTVNNLEPFSEENFIRLALRFDLNATPSTQSTTAPEISSATTLEQPASPHEAKPIPPPIQPLFEERFISVVTSPTHSGIPNSSTPKSMPTSVRLTPVEPRPRVDLVQSACNLMTEKEIKALWKSTREQNVVSFFSTKSEAEIVYRKIQEIYSTIAPSQFRNLLVLSTMHQFVVKNGQPQTQAFATALNTYFDLSSISYADIDRQMLEAQVNEALHNPHLKPQMVY